MKSFLCKIGWHKWTKWITWYGTSLDWQTLYQHRMCVRCEKEQQLKDDPNMCIK